MGNWRHTHTHGSHRGVVKLVKIYSSKDRDLSPRSRHRIGTNLVFIMRPLYANRCDAVTHIWMDNLENCQPSTWAWLSCLRGTRNPKVSSSCLMPMVMSRARLDRFSGYRWPKEKTPFLPHVISGSDLGTRISELRSPIIDGFGFGTSELHSFGQWRCWPSGISLSISRPVLAVSMANRLLRQTAVLLLLADLFNWLTFSQIARQHPRIKKK